MARRKVNELALRRQLIKQLQAWHAQGLLHHFSNDSVTDLEGTVEIEASVWLDHKNPALQGSLRLAVLDLAEQLSEETGLSVDIAELHDPPDYVDYGEPDQHAGGKDHRKDRSGTLTITLE